jgi:hypothetical protein
MALYIGRRTVADVFGQRDGGLRAVYPGLKWCSDEPLSSRLIFAFQEPQIHAARSNPARCGFPQALERGIKQEQRHRSA